jgi:hypothetical protein
MHWRIEGRDGAETFWQRDLPGNLGEKRIVELLRRLASRHLDPDEIVPASLPPRNPEYRPLLEPQGEADGGWPIVVGQNPFYLARKTNERLA